MFKFNENNSITGYIKELLHNFNLPSCSVYRDGMEIYSNKNYIYHNSIIKTIKELPNGTTTLTGNYNYVQSYIYDQPVLNITNTFQPKSLLYDTETHEWLGAYLRFVRDYTGVNVMPLYNCFSNRQLNNLSYNSFLSSDTNYKIYAIPVDFNKCYLIGIDSAQPVYMACGLYKNALITSINTSKLYSQTSKTFNQMSVTSPSLYSTFIEDDTQYNSFEKALKLFIKLPATNNSTISIIETGLIKESQLLPVVYGSKSNGKVTNVIIPNDNLDVYLPTKLSLFKMNDHNSYPFADRLVEYLMGNAITKNESISENIERVQKQLLSSEQLIKNGAQLKTLGHYGVWNDYIRTTCYNACTNKIILNDTNSQNAKRFIDMNFDIVGIDKNVENLITVIPDNSF